MATTSQIRIAMAAEEAEMARCQRRLEELSEEQARLVRRIRTAAANLRDLVQHIEAPADPERRQEG